MMITVPMYALSLCLSDMKTICVYTTRVVCSKSQSFSTSWFECPDPWDQSQVYLSTQCLHYKMAMKKFCQKVTVRSIQSSLINTSNRHNKLILDSILQVVKSPQSCHVDIIYYYTREASWQWECATFCGTSYSIHNLSISNRSQWY